MAQAHNRLPDEVRADALRLYQDGLAVAHIAKRLGLGQTTVSRWLKAKGISPATDMTRWHRHVSYKFSAEQEAEIVARYTSGERAAPLAGEYGCNYATIINICHRHGVRPHRSVVVRTLPEDEVQRIIARYQAGESQESIAQSYGVGQGSISSLLRGRGIKGVVSRCADCGSHNIVQVPLTEALDFSVA